MTTWKGMKTIKTMLIIVKADGTEQVIKPDLRYFKDGDWLGLAKGITNSEFPRFRTM